MKALIIRGTTLRGEPLDEGTIVDLDEATFHLLKSQQQAVQATPELLKQAAKLGIDGASEEEDPKASKAKAPKAKQPATPPQE